MHTHSFQYYLPVNLIFGPGKTELLGEEAVRYGKKVLIVTGRHSTKRSGLLDRAKSLLEKAGAEVTVFDEVEPNPLASTVMKGAGIVKETGIHVGNIRYLSSQCWPFPNSLMLGFTAEYVSGEAKPDGIELDTLGWFRADSLPPLPPPGSIARKIIEEFKQKYTTADRKMEPRS